MGRLPSHIFVVRHGNRLDAADKQWHLTSPTPYDPPLTYGGFLQARLVGNQIASVLELAKIDAEVTENGAALTGRRRRFNIVIHSSPFLRCVQTSVGISSGLAQTPSNSIYRPSDVIVPRNTPNSPGFQFKSALLRLDPCLGEWLSPEYFEMITPPPGPALMIGSAKAELLRREDYSMYIDSAASNNHLIPSNALWNASSTSESNDILGTSALAAGLPAGAGERKGYVPPRPMYAVSSGGKIPEGFVAHARDATVMVDYQWDSMRPPLDFGDGGKFGEEWTAMHQRFRRGLKKLVNWYATTDNPDELMSAPVKKENGNSRDSDYEKKKEEEEEEDVETVVIIVSHGAGCNALIGAITHQPVLMDVGIASITMAVRKPDLAYSEALLSTRSRDPKASGLVAVDDLYDIRLSASTEHLRSNSSTPVSARSNITANTWNSGRRGRTSTFGSATGGPVLSPFTYREPFSSVGSRSSSASATVGVGPSLQRDSGSGRPSSRASALAMSGLSGSGTGYPTNGMSSSGLWAPGRSSLRLMDDGNDGEAADDFDSCMPDFDNKRFKTAVEHMVKEEAASQSTTEPFPDMAPAVQLPPLLNGPVFAAPIKLHTDFGLGSPAEEVALPQLGGGLGGLWGLPQPPDEAERFRDLSHTKRRWTVNERA